MPKPIDSISISEDHVDAGQEIETELLRSLREALPQADNNTFVLSARNDEGDIVGGLTASTSYGWLLVKALWIAAAYRRRHIGMSLMERAEMVARSMGCHSAWLDTSNPHAQLFYSKLGYTVFGCLANSIDQHPKSHHRWFMKKAL